MAEAVFLSCASMEADIVTMEAHITGVEQCIMKGVDVLK
jgi:hypothetical protein